MFNITIILHCLAHNKHLKYEKLKFMYNRQFTESDIGIMDYPDNPSDISVTTVSNPT